MIKYDLVYDRLFNDEKFVEILMKFHSSNWDNLDKKQRFAVLNEFVDRYSEIFNLGDMKIKKNGNKNYAGAYLDIKSLVNVNEQAIEESSQYDVMDTLFHELRHNFQHRAISRNLSEFENVSEEERRKWKMNFLVSPRGYHNYITVTGDNSWLYLYQPVEKDAFMTGLSLTKKAYEIIKEKLGEDRAFVSYAVMNRDKIMLFFSDEEKYTSSIKNGEEAVFQIFERNNKERELEKKCMLIANETMKKDISDMSIEEIMSLFSVYVWAYLDDDYKISLLEEYDHRVNKYKSAKIVKESNSAFKICGKACVREDIGSILNDLFSFQFAVMVEGMIHGKIPCDPKLKEELTVNMYTENKKRINYVRDVDNFLLYSIQPYALFEGRTIIEWFKKLKEVETKFYGIDNGDYEHWIDFYDNDKYIPYIEKFYDKPFDEIYSELVDSMKKKINPNKRV